MPTKPVLAAVLLVSFAVSQAAGLPPMVHVKECDLAPDPDVKLPPAIESLLAGENPWFVLGPNAHAVAETVEGTLPPECGYETYDEPYESTESIAGSDQYGSYLECRGWSVGSSQHCSIGVPGGTGTWTSLSFGPADGAATRFAIHNGPTVIYEFFSNNCDPSKSSGSYAHTFTFTRISASVESCGQPFQADWSFKVRYH